MHTIALTHSPSPCVFDRRAPEGLLVRGWRASFHPQNKGRSSLLRGGSVSNSAKASLWVVRPRPAAAARIRLFCFPHAGGGPSAFRRWAPSLAPEIECCLVQLPGKERRVLETPLRKMQEVVVRVYSAILPLLDRPFAFFGHSMGGIVAFEVARALRRGGGPLPSRIIVSATRAPTVPDPDPPLVHQSDAEFLAEIQSRYDSIPKDVLDSSELLELVLPGLRADFEAMESHQHRFEPPLDVPFTALGGIEDHRVREAAIAAWSEQAGRDFEIQMFPGAHFYIQSSEANLLRFLRARLERLLPAS